MPRIKYSFVSLGLCDWFFVYLFWEIKRKACVFHWTDPVENRMCDGEMALGIRDGEDWGKWEPATDQSSSQLYLVCIRHRPMA